MKHIFAYILIFSLWSVTLVQAEESNVPIIKRQQMMLKHQQKGEYREAMIIATEILSEQSSNRTATDFIHANWEKMSKATNAELDKVSDPNNLEQTKKRCLIYEQLTQINDNLMTVPMPLYGANNRWVWQPEIGYYQGIYDEERNRTFFMLRQAAKEALESYDAESAKLYYEDALHNFLERDGERSSNRQLMVADCNAILSRMSKSDKLYDLIFAYDLCRLTLWLDNTQNDVTTLQHTIQLRVADAYQQLAQEYLQAGDSVRANQYLLNATEWK